jgi:hypothetical protein
LHLELQPSRALPAALMLIGVLGAAGTFLSDLSLPLAALISPVFLAWGALLAGRALRADVVRIAFRADGSVTVDGIRVHGVQLDWRGPLTVMEWQREGRRVRQVAWPDVVPPGLRRELRLWRLARRADASTRPVAP